MGKLAQIKWPQEYSELQRIEELLLCGICYEYLDTSVMTPCSHNYCSLCIRKYLHYKTQCPACFEKTFEKDLHTNRILDELVFYFGGIREKLVERIVGAKIVARDEHANNEETMKITPIRPARTNQSTKKNSPKIDMQIARITSDDILGEDKDAKIIDEQLKISSSPSTSAILKVAKIFTPKSKKKSVNCIENGKIVPCPVCRVEVSEININKHLDDCLKRETVKREPERIEPKRKPLPKLVFSLMKDAELRKKMKDLGLPSQGDRKTLEARFHRYSTLYNAECDKREPRSIDELLKQCENDENLEKKMLKISQAANRLKVTRNCEQSVIEEEQKKYLENNRRNYHDLIAAIKEREENKRKLKARRCLIDKNVDGSANDVSKINDKKSPDKNDRNDDDDDEDDDLVNYSMNAFEANFQDSDSSTSCPLQHYASDVPMNFLSFEMTNGDENVTPLKIHRKSKIFDSNGNDDESSSREKSTSTIKNLHSPNVDRAAMIDEVSSISKDIYCATTDEETSDDDVVPPSPDEDTSRTKKRAKLSLKRETENSTIGSYEITEGEKLAASIARDFTFDGSSNDSTESAKDKKMTETIIDDSRKHRENEAKREKKNDESSTRDSRVIDRPLGKRNSVVRGKNIEAATLGRSRDKQIGEKIVAPGDETSVRICEKEDETLSRVDSPLKRRRQRKTTTIQAETNVPPRRPLRKRLVNSSSTNNVKK